MNQVLNVNERLLEQVINKDIVNIFVNSTMDNTSVNVHECEKCLKLETELLNKKDFIEKVTYDKLFRSYTALEKHCISLEVDTQLTQEIFQRDNSVSNQRVKPSTSAGGSQPSGNTKKDKIQQTPRSTENNKVEAHPRTVKSSLKNKNCAVEPKGTAFVIIITVEVSLRKPTALESDSPKPEVTLVYLRKPRKSKSTDLVSKSKHSKFNANSELICVKCNGCMLFDNHDLCVPNDVNARAKSKSVKIIITVEVSLRKPTALESDSPKPEVTLVYLRKPRKSKSTDLVSKSKVNKYVSANKKEPSKSSRSTVFNVPSFSLDECRLSKLFSGIWTLAAPSI
nr:hypothetical protein [Tanacetum cinerariifolium]